MTAYSKVNQLNEDRFSSWTSLKEVI